MRMGARAIATAAVLTAIVQPLYADEPAAVAPPSPPAAAPADEAWRAYDDAFVQLGRGRRDAATAGLLQLTTRWPTHPAARQATLRLAELEARAATRAAKRADRVARGEVVFWSTASSVLLARDLCLDTCESDRSAAAVYSLTIGAALGVSLFATRHGVRPGEAQLYNSAQTWGSWNALAINDGFAETRGEAAVAIGGQLAGLAAGLGLWQTWRPEAGDVALANTGLLWSAVLSLYGQLMVDVEPELRTVVVVGDLGLLAGALIARKVPMSRGRTLLIDLGGVLGTLAGGLVSLSADDEQAVGGILFTTTAAGLVIAGFATRGWDVDLPRAARLVPARVGTPGVGAGWGAALAIDL
jgi:hypothetical protein